ncbi:MAG: hypothetical protein QXP22_03005 [Candidatus Anstonellales archaeon]
MPDQTATEKQIDVKQLAQKYGVSEEVLSAYVNKFQIKNEGELIDRLVKQGYAKIWPRTFFGRIAYLVRTDRGLIESILNEKDPKEKARYASTIEAAMLVELAAKRKGLGDEEIADVIKSLAELKDVGTEAGRIRLSLLQVIGIAYDGFDSIGQSLELPAKEKNVYMEATIGLIMKALFDEKKLKTGKELYDSVAYLNLTLAKGYSILISNEQIGEREQKVDLTKSMNDFYDELSKGMNDLRGVVERLVEGGKLPSKYLHLFDAEAGKLASIYLIVSEFYDKLQKFYKDSISKNSGDQEKEEFEKQYRKLAKTFADMNAKASTMTVANQFALILIQERLSYRSAGDREAFSIVSMRRQNFLTQIMNSMTADEYLSFVAELLDEDWYEKSINLRSMKYRDFNEYLEDKIKEKWSDVVWQQIKEKLKQKNITINENNEEDVKSLLWDYGYDINDVVFMLKNNVNLKDVIAQIEQLKKEDNDIRSELVSLAKRVGIEEDFMPLFLEPLIRRIALIQIMNKQLPDNEKVDVLNIIKEHLKTDNEISAFNEELNKNEYFAKGSEEQKQGLRILKLVESIQPKLPVKYVEVEQKPPESPLQPQPPQGATETRVYYKPAGEKKKGKGYSITASYEYSQEFLGYYPSVAWIVKYAKGSRVNDLNGLKEFVIRRYFGYVSEEANEVYRRRYNAVFDYFLNNTQRIFDSMSDTEKNNLRDSARKLIQELGLSNKISVEDAAAVLFAIQAVEYPFEDLVGNAFNAQNWIAGWQKATEGININRNVFGSQQKIENIQETIKAKNLKPGTYNIDILKPNGERITVYRVNVDNRGNVTVNAAAKDDILVTKNDRLVLTPENDRENIIMASSASMAILMLSQKNEKEEDNKKDALIWRNYFVLNGDVELGYGSVSRWGGEFSITMPVPSESVSRAPQLPKVEFYGMIDNVGTPIFIQPRKPDLTLLPVVPVVSLPTTATESIIRTEVVGYEISLTEFRSILPSDVGGNLAEEAIKKLQQNLTLTKQNGNWVVNVPTDDQIDQIPNIGENTKEGLKNVAHNLRNYNYTVTETNDKIFIEVKDSNGQKLGGLEFDKKDQEKIKPIIKEVREQRPRELTLKEKQKLFADRLRRTAIVGLEFREGPFTIQPQIMFVNGKFVNPGVGISTAFPIFGNENVGLAWLLSASATNALAIYGMAALSPYVRLGDLTVSPFVGFSSAGLMWGAGASYAIGGGKFGLSWARSPIPSVGLINTYTVSYERENWSVNPSISVIQVGPYFVPILTVIVSGAERAVNWLLEQIGLRTEDVDAWGRTITRDPEEMAEELFKNAEST